MNTQKGRFSVGWALGLFLGIVSAGAIVYAGSIGDLYTDGAKLTAAMMNNIKAAVNDNDTRITSLETGTGTCVTNNTSDEMVRVGPICVDKNKATLWDGTGEGATSVTAIPGGCNLDGTGTCEGMVAQSRAAGTPVDGNLISWAQAQRACTNAGKRLLTPGEWMAAFSSGLATGIETENKQEYIDAVAGGTGLAKAGYMGVTTAAGGVAAALNLQHNLIGSVGGTPYNGNFLGFRCAR